MMQLIADYPFTSGVIIGAVGIVVLTAIACAVTIKLFTWIDNENQRKLYEQRTKEINERRQS